MSKAAVTDRDKPQSRVANNPNPQSKKTGQDTGSRQSGKVSSASGGVHIVIEQVRGMNLMGQRVS